MKYRVYTYILLSVLIFYIFRPVIPYIEYAVNKDYIAKNLCINRDKPQNCCEGKCYLEKQLKNSTENTTDASGKNTSEKAQNEDVKEFTSSHVTIPKVFETVITPPVNHGSFTVTLIVLFIFVPPRLKSIF